MTEKISNSKAETFIGMFQFQGGIFHNALENLEQEDALKRPSENSNHINWLLGHIVHCRYMLANMLGVKAENPFGKTFWTAIENKDYPTIKEVVSQFPEISNKLLDKISSIGNEAFDAKPSPDQPSTADLVSFFIYHEAYHIGQIGYARKLIGLEAMKSH
ncbi:MAG: hypothetical protein DHS20C18_37180 [Saprospiraceae bacterium]|nr:MAG: hypothetical protein DHS20C18_37180 [Saprospiraceae bacterium]